MCIRHRYASESATTPASSGSPRSAVTSLTSSAPSSIARRDTSAFAVSIDTGRPWTPSSTGTTRRSSSSTLTPSEPGRVDSPPTSTIAAPSATIRRAETIAASGSRLTPPSEKESGVTFTTPITEGRGKRSASGGRADTIWILCPMREGEARRRAAWRFVRAVVRSQAGGVVGAVVFGLLWQTGAVAAPLIVKYAIDHAIVPRDRHALLLWLLALLGVGLLEVAGGGMRHIFAIRNRAGSDARVRDAIFAHALRLDAAYHDRVGPGELMSRASSDSEQVARMMDSIGHTIGYALTVVAVAAVMLAIDARLALVVLIPLPFVSLVAWRYSLRYDARTRRLQEAWAEAATLVEESVSGIRVVKGLGAGTALSGRFRRRSDEIVRRALEVARVDAVFNPALETLPLLGIAAVLWFGGRRVAAGDLSLGSFVAFNAYVVMLVWPLRILGQRVSTLQKALAAGARITEVLETEPRLREARHPRELARPVRGNVRLEAVRFGTAGEQFLGSLRTAAFDRLQALPLGFFERERAGVLVSRLTADVQSLTEFIREALIEVVGSGLQIVLTMVALVIVSPTLAAVSLVALPILLVSSWTFHHSAGRVYHAIRDRVADTLTALQEGLAGVRVVQAFRRERRTIEAYHPRSQAQVRAWRRASFVNIRLFTMIPLAQTVALIAVLLVAASSYRHGSISEGTIAAFALYLVQLFDPIARFSEWLGEFRQGLAALGKIVGLLRTPSAILESTDAVELPGEGTLALHDVTFSYDGERAVVREITIGLEPGEHVALVGATGAGKSTLAKLLTRQYDPQCGTISLGGVDLRDASVDSLHCRIVMLPQEGHLFSGTIADNVRIAHPGASDDDVRAALRRIGALDRFDSLTNGLETDVQTRGLRLSAGERQLVGIARVALADPAVIVLDEATSSLDPATEAAGEGALAAVAAGRPGIPNAHPLSTAGRADRVA